MNSEGMLTVRGVSWLCFLVILIMIVSNILVGVIYSMLFLDTPSFNVYNFFGTQILSILIPGIIYLKWKDLKIGDVCKIKKISPVYIVISLIFGFSCQYVARIANIPVLIFLKDLADKIPQLELEVYTPKQLIISILTIAVAPAICEEFLMRGIVLSAFYKTDTKLAIFVSSLLFAFLHMSIANFLGPLFLGVVFSIIVLRTGSILPAMCAHFANNFFAVILEYLNSNHESHFLIQENNQVFILLVSLVIFVLCFNFLRRGYDKNIYKNVISSPIINISNIASLLIFIIFQILIFIAAFRNTI